MVKTVKYSALLTFFLGIFFVPASAQLIGTPIGGGSNDGCIDYKSICLNCYCLDVWRPVCGCNGVTYSNSCYASRSGVTSWTEGACGTFSSLENQGQRLFFQSPEGDEVEMNIFDTRGRRMSAPIYTSMVANTTYTLNHALAAGDYICQIKTDAGVENRAFSVN